jgi:battenin
MAQLQRRPDGAAVVEKLGSRRNIAAFWLCGCVNNIVYVVYLSAAEDLLETKAGVVLLVSVLPGLLMKMALPIFAHHLSFTLRIALTSLTVFSCCVGVALAGGTPLRLFFLCTSSCVGALGEATFLSLTALYAPATVGAWSSGTGAAGVCGAALYAFLRSSLSLSNTQALLFISPIALLLLVVYLVVLTPPMSHDEEYTAIGESDDGIDNDEIEISSAAAPVIPAPASADSVHYEPVVFPELPHGVSAERAMLPWLVIHYISPLMIVYLFEYMINQGVAPTMDYFSGDTEAQVLSADSRSKLYSIFQVSYQVGVFASRSSIEFVKIPRIWRLAPIQALNFIALLLLSAYRLLPSRWFVVAVMFFEGLIGGAMYVNAFYKLRRVLPQALKSWALGAASVGDASGITLAAIVNIWLECAIRRFRGEPLCAVVAGAVSEATTTTTALAMLRLPSSTNLSNSPFLSHWLRKILPFWEES